MPDQEDALPGALDEELVEQFLDAGYCVAVALAARERLVDTERTLTLDGGHRRAVQVAVVDLAQAPVEDDGNGGPRERDLGRLDGA